MAFIFGSGTGSTYDEMIRRRALADAYTQSIGTPNTFGEGLSALGKGLAGGLLTRNANKMEKEGKAAAQERAQSVLGQLYGARLQPASYSPAPQAATGAVQPKTPGQAVASDTMAALGKQDGGWLKYSNDGAIRNDPIAPELQTAMSFLPEMGVTMEVFSGGQEPAGAGGSRTGSTRHDHGNAADVFFYKDGRRLDWNNPQDRPLFEEIVKRGKAAGVTGFGAGDGYMQAGSMHVGFGNPGVWGAGGKGENAADWLQAAYNGTEAPPVVKVAGGGGQIDPTAAMQSMGAGMDPAAVMAAISDPYLDEGTRNVLGMLFQQQIQRQNQMTDPAYQMQLEASRLANQKAQMEIAQFGQPQVPKGLEERRAFAAEAGLQPGTPEYQEYMATGDLPKRFRELSPEEVRALGLPPGAYQRGADGKIVQVGGGGVTVNMPGQPTIGTVPQGYAVVADPNNPSGYRMAPIPGGPEDTSAKDAARAGMAQTASDTVITAAQRAREAANNRALGSFGQGIVQRLPWTDSAEVARQGGVLTAMASVENINAMRQASPTGGALGAASDADLKLLRDKGGALDPNSPYYERDLADYTRMLLRTIHGQKAGDEIFEREWNKTNPPVAPPTGAPIAAPQGAPQGNPGNDPLGLFK